MNNMSKDSVDVFQEPLKSKDYARPARLEPNTIKEPKVVSQFADKTASSRTIDAFVNKGTTK